MYIFKLYDLDLDFECYLEKMSNLEMETLVWPTPNHMKLMGIKLQLIWHMDWIIKKLDLLRPKTVILQRGDIIPHISVLKRMQSN